VSEVPLYAYIVVIEHDCPSEAIESLSAFPSASPKEVAIISEGALIFGGETTDGKTPNPGLINIRDALTKIISKSKKGGNWMGVEEYGNLLLDLSEFVRMRIEEGYQIHEVIAALEQTAFNLRMLAFNEAQEFMRKNDMAKMVKDMEEMRWIGR
jgi:hypothetical protein